MTTACEGFFREARSNSRRSSWVKMSSVVMLGMPNCSPTSPTTFPKTFSSSARSVRFKILSVKSWGFPFKASLNSSPVNTSFTSMSNPAKMGLILSFVSRCATSIVEFITATPMLFGSQTRNRLSLMACSISPPANNSSGSMPILWKGSPSRLVTWPFRVLNTNPFAMLWGKTPPKVFMTVSRACRATSYSCGSGIDLGRSLTGWLYLPATADSGEPGSAMIARRRSSS
mmetsp:Transcript_39015/g.102229  ORF Transcript_39015/g.102229 Transcript_39015/m.102229 type:complete len:229 (-) Transcript_39015:944-1630(-)